MAKILLVEDDRRLSALLARRLSEEGHSAETAATGPEGLRRSLADGYDVLILDRMLPGLDGVSVAGELRAHGVAAQDEKARDQDQREDDEPEEKTSGRGGHRCGGVKRWAEARVTRRRAAPRRETPAASGAGCRPSAGP